MKKLTKDFYDHRKSETKSKGRTAQRKEELRRREIVDTLKPEILLRLSKWLELKSIIDCLPPDKKENLDEILFDRQCDKNCKDQQTDICLIDSGDEDSCPFNLIRKILKTEITEKSKFVLSTDQTPYFQIKDILEKL